MKEIIQKIDEVYKRYDYVENKGEMLLFLIKILMLKFLVDNGRVVLDRKNAQKLRMDFTVGGILRYGAAASQTPITGLMREN